MTLVAQQTDVLLVLQAKQEALYRMHRTNTSENTSSQQKNDNLSIKMNLNISDLSCAKHLILHVATAKLFLHCGTGGSIQHLLFHLQPSEGEIYLQFVCVCCCRVIEFQTEFLQCSQTH